MLITYEKILEIASEILSNELIPHDNLTIMYKLPEKQHYKLNEHLFFMQNKNKQASDFEYNKIFEVEIGGILFKFEVLKSEEIKIENESEEKE